MKTKNINPWHLTFDKFEPERENLRETLCTLGNGYLGTRGAVPENIASRVHYPGTYIAGVYNALPTEIARRTIINEDFVNCPNWLMLNYRVDDGPWFDRMMVRILSWRVELNMKKGVLSRRLRWQDAWGRITLIENHRLVSMADPHYCAMRCTIIPENYSGKITIRSGIDGLIINAGVERYKQLNSKHLEPLSLGSFGKNRIYLQMQTNKSKIQITEAQKTICYQGNERIFPKIRTITHGRERIMHEFSMDVTAGGKYSVEKIISIYTSRDVGVADNCNLAQKMVRKADSFQELFKAHQAKWAALWKKFDIEIEGDPFTQMVSRLHTFHLLQSASTYNADIDAGLPARGLHGEAYRGHIFWDEMYSFPFYNLHAPEITRALLMYRYRRLKAAKDYARQNGFKGAMFPWQSASTGEETTQVIHLNPMSGKWGPDYSSLQRHVSIAIAYNVWTYYITTGDRDFLDRYGAEMLLEISHFWSSAATLDPKKKRYVINGVMGPDEFHEKYPAAEKGGVNNNAYTNVMVVWVLSKTLELLDSIPEEERKALLYKLNINEEEIQRWRDITKKMYLPIDKNGIIHQFDGYKELKELNWKQYRAKYDNIHRIDRILKAEGLSPDIFKVAKQADVLMIFYLLADQEVEEIFHQCGYTFNKAMTRKNFDYYIHRTSHGSTLSRIVHAYIANKLKDRETCMNFFQQALESDIFDTQGGTTQEGIHVGVMAGTIHLLLYCFAGLSIWENRICLNPKLPKQWSKVAFQVRYKSLWFAVTITKEEISVFIEPHPQILFSTNGGVPIEINKKIHKVKPGKKFVVKIK